MMGATWEYGRRRQRWMLNSLGAWVRSPNYHGPKRDDDLVEESRFRERSPYNHRSLPTRYHCDSFSSSINYSDRQCSCEYEIRSGTSLHGGAARLIPPLQFDRAVATFQRSNPQKTDGVDSSVEFYRRRYNATKESLVD